MINDSLDAQCPPDSGLPPSQATVAKSNGFWARLGPGLITGASDDDPSGIATYSQAGAQFGYGLLWSVVLTYPLMAAIQEISAHIGRVTGCGISANLRKSYSTKILYPIIGLLMIVNTINVGVDLGAMAAAAKLVIGGSVIFYCFAFAAFSAVAQVLIPYHRYVSYIKWSTLVLFAYVATVLTVHVPWAQVARETLLPPISFHRDYLQMLMAILGTTISPYLFFWQASLEVEDERHDSTARPLRNDLEHAPAQLHRIKVDTFFGMGISNLIAFFIIVTTAATLHVNGIIHIETAEQAAEALRPIAGNFCFLLFSLGMIGTGLLAVPVLAGSAAYAVGECFKWRTGLERKAKAAPKFYTVIVIATGIGVLINLLNINSIQALYWTAILNGVIAVPVMPMMMLMASNKKLMGSLTISSRLKWFGWAATLLMAISALGLVVTSF